MNIELFTKDIGKKIVGIGVKEESLTIGLEDGEIDISTYHDQDCCEHVYGDFSILKYSTEALVGNTLSTITIKSVPEMGFLIVFKVGHSDWVKIFVPCYNSQNGYYSANLSLNVKYEGVETKVDISDLVEDNIN